MAEDKNEEKKEKLSAEQSTQVSSAQKNENDENKNNLKNSNKDAEPVKDKQEKKDDKVEVEFAETDEDLTKNNKSSKKTPKQKIDKKKIERIKRELFADDEETLEKINQAAQESQIEDGENLPKDEYRTKDGKLISRSERIAKKNEQLLEEVYRYNRQKTKDISVRKQETLNVVLIVILFLLLIAVLALGIYLYLQKITSYDEDYIRVSVSMTNKDIFYETEVTGDLIPKSVSPGDKFNLNIIARNSNNILGDNDGEDWTDIYVRFKITLIIDGVSYDDFIYVEPNQDVWERYNKEIEDGYLNSETDPTPVVKEDDGYYYCRLILEPNQQVTVIDWLRFSEVYITELVGGSDAVLQVDIEALEAIPNIIKNREIWVNAPQHWVLYMTDPETHPGTGEDAPKPNSDINVWWIILFISLAVILTVTIVFISTRKKTSKKKMDDLSRRLNRRE